MRRHQQLGPASSLQESSLVPGHRLGEELVNSPAYQEHTSRRYVRQSRKAMLLIPSQGKIYSQHGALVDLDDILF